MRPRLPRDYFGSLTCIGVPARLGRRQLLLGETTARERGLGSSARDPAERADTPKGDQSSLREKPYSPEHAMPRQLKAGIAARAQRVRIATYRAIMRPATLEFSNSPL